MGKALERNPGWSVVLAGLGINLALGVLYTWSVISKGIPESWGWSEADKSWPYSICCLVFCLVMVPAGRMQDRFGPRVVTAVGGLLVGIGMIVASYTTSPLGYILGFGVLTGAGIGCGYASATPPAIKWFPAAKTGMIAGLVVSGFGLASVYIAPLANSLIETYGVASTVLWFGVGFLIVVVGLAQLLKAPPPGYVPVAPATQTTPDAPQEQFTPSQMLQTWQFYALWFMYACGAGAGLMVIAKLAKIAQAQASIDMGFLLVAVLALGNGAGRILAGMHSDIIGRKLTLGGNFLAQAVLVVLLSQVVEGGVLASMGVLALISAVIGANYGANLSLFPAITKDYYGTRHFGMNYGLVFTAWGVGGFMLAMLAGKVFDSSQSFRFAYNCSVVLLVAAAIVTRFVKPPKKRADRSVIETRSGSGLAPA